MFSFFKKNKKSQYENIEDIFSTWKNNLKSIDLKSDSDNIILKEDGCFYGLRYSPGAVIMDESDLYYFLREASKDEIKKYQSFAVIIGEIYKMENIDKII